MNDDERVGVSEINGMEQGTGGEAGDGAGGGLEHFVGMGGGGCVVGGGGSGPNGDSISRYISTNRRRNRRANTEEFM